MPPLRHHVLLDAILVQAMRAWKEHGRAFAVATSVNERVMANRADLPIRIGRHLGSTIRYIGGLTEHIFGGMPNKECQDEALSGIWQKREDVLL